MVRRRHRILRALAWTVLGLITLVVASVGAVVVALSTDWGREELRVIAESQLQKIVDGTVTVGKITGSPLSHFHIASFTVADAAGQKALVTGDLELAWDPLALVGQRFHATEVVVSGPIIRATQGADGSLNVAHLLKPKNEPDTGPSAWKVDLDRILVRDALVALPLGPGGQTTLAALDANATLLLDGSTLDATLAILRASWIERGVPLEVRGRVVMAPDLIAASQVEVHAGGSRVAIPYAIYGPKAGNAVATLDATLRESDAMLFWPHPMILGDVTLAGVVARPSGDAPAEGHLHVTGLGGDVVADLRAEPGKPALRGELHVRGVKAPGELAARADLDATFDVTGKSVTTAQGKISLGARGVVLGRTIDDLKIDATLAGGVARADFTVKAAGASAQGHADLRLGDEIVIDGARLRAEVADLGKIKKGFGGHVAADVTVRGTPRALAAAGQVTADGIAAGPATVGTARVSFDLRGLPGAPNGTAAVVADEVVAGGQKLGRVSVDARGDGKRLEVRVAAGGPQLPYSGAVAGRVTLGDRATRIALGDIRLTARGLAFTGKGGTFVVEKSGALQAHDLRLASNAGSLEVDGKLNAPRSDVGRYRPIAPDGELHLHLDSVDLAKLQTAFALSGDKLGGVVSLDTHLVRDGKNLGVQGELLARAVIAGDRAPPIDAMATVNLGEGKLVTTAHVRERVTGGVVDLALQARVPKDVLDSAAWKSVDVEQALSGAILQLRQIDVGTMASLARQKGYAGRIDGTVVAKPGARSIAWDVVARDVVAPEVKGVTLVTRGTWDHEAIDGIAQVELQGTHIVDVSARLEAGINSYLHGNARELGATPFTAEATTSKLAIDKLRGVLPTKVRLAGLLDVDVKAKGTLADPSGTAKLHLADARIAKVQFASVDAEGTFDAAKVNGKVVARQTGGGSLDLALSLDRKSANALGAQVTARKFDLGFIPALARSATDALAGVGGKLDADVKVTVDANGRNASGQLALDQGSFYVPTSGAVTQVQLKATIGNGKVVLTELKGRAGSGSLDGKGEAVVDGLQPKSLNLTVNLDRVPVLAGSQTVAASTKVKLTGQAEGPSQWNLNAELSDTTVRMPKTKRGGGKLQPTGPLDDVVFVDEPDFAQRQALLVLTGSEEVNQSNGMDITIKLDTHGGVNVTGQELDIILTPNLTVYQRQGQTTVAGSVEVDHGYIELFGRRWDIDRANASFDPNGPPNPSIDVEVEHQFQTTTVYVAVTGTVQKPKLDLRADPGSYDQAQILGWVLGGDPDTATSTDKQPLQDKAVGVASNLLLGQVQSQLRDALPIDVLNVQVGEASSQTTTRVEIGKWITDKLFVGYQARLNAPDTENVNEAEIQYRLGKRWLLDAFFGDRSVGGADILWSNKY